MSATDPEFLELCVDLRIEVGASGTGPLAVTGQTGEYQRIVEWIPAAQMKIETMHDDWKFLHQRTTISTTASQREYSLGQLGITDLATWDERSFVYNPTSDAYRKLKELSYEEWRGNQALGTVVEDEPSRVVILPDNGIVLFPTPDTGSVNIGCDYWKVPTRMTAATDTSAIPAQYRRIIVCMAKMMYGAMEDAPEIYQDGKAEFDEMLEQLRSNQLPGMSWKRRQETPDIVVVPE